MVIGPVAVVASSLLLLRLGLLAGPPGRTRVRLAFRGLRTRQSRLPWLLTDVLTPLVGVIALASAFAIEQEVRQGPGRAIDQLVVDTDPARTWWLLQDGSDHFMNNSTLPTGTAEAVTALATTADGVDWAYPFWAVLVQVDLARSPLTALVFGAGDNETVSPLSPRVSSDANCRVVNERCALDDDQIIVDANNGMRIGDLVEIRGSAFTVAGISQSPRGMLNRPVLFVNHAGFERIEGSGIEPFGAVLGGDAGPVADLVKHVADPEFVDLVATASLRSANERFWTGNGTPLLLLLVLLICAFAGAAMFAARQTEHERNRAIVGTLRAIGLNRWSAIELDLAQSALTVLKVTVPAWLIASALIVGANRAILGFTADLTLNHVIGATGLLVLVAQTSAAVLAFRERRIELIELMRHD